jgi:hypothetical protein
MTDQDVRCPDHLPPDWLGYMHAVDFAQQHKNKGQWKCRACGLWIFPCERGEPCLAKPACLSANKALKGEVSRSAK